MYKKDMEGYRPNEGIPVCMDEVGQKKDIFYASYSDSTSDCPHLIYLTQSYCYTLPPQVDNLGFQLVFFTNDYILTKCFSREP